MKDVQISWKVSAFCDNDLPIWSQLDCRGKNAKEGD
jgi:hypothetical protein